MASTGIECLLWRKVLDARNHADIIGGGIMRKLHTEKSEFGAVLTAALLLFILVGLFACSNPTSDNNSNDSDTGVVEQQVPTGGEDTGQEEQPTGAPAAEESDQPSRGSALLAPYDCSEFVNYELIFNGEILSVETVTSTAEYDNYGEPYIVTEEESLMTVKVHAVYAGKIPGDKNEIIVYCPVANSSSYRQGLSLSQGKKYVFFAENWNEQNRAYFASFGYDKYEFDKRSDVYLPANIYNLAIAEGDYVITLSEWGDVVEPSDIAEDEYLALKKGYGSRDDDSIGLHNCVYTEARFIEALSKLKELYPAS
jgi:hypothetical protein